MYSIVQNIIEYSLVFIYKCMNVHIYIQNYIKRSNLSTIQEYSRDSDNRMTASPVNVRSRILFLLFLHHLTFISLAKRSIYVSFDFWLDKGCFHCSELTGFGLAWQLFQTVFLDPHSPATTGGFDQSIHYFWKVFKFHNGVGCGMTLFSVKWFSLRFNGNVVWKYI